MRLNVTLSQLAFALPLLLLGCGRSYPPVDLDKVRVNPITGMELAEMVQHAGAKVVLVNLWATWCGPCREEFPSLVRLHREYHQSGVKVILVSADFETDLMQVKGFLGRQGVDFLAYLKSDRDIEFINALYPNWSGAIPLTLIYDNKGNLQHYWEGAAPYSVFERSVLEVLYST